MTSSRILGRLLGKFYTEFQLGNIDFTWGDGLRIDVEAYDDRNITNGDGCCYSNFWDYFRQKNK